MYLMHILCTHGCRKNSYYGQEVSENEGAVKEFVTNRVDIVECFSGPSSDALCLTWLYLLAVWSAVLKFDTTIPSPTLHLQSLSEI